MEEEKKEEPVTEETKKENILTKKKEVKGTPLKIWLIVMIAVFMLITFGLGVYFGKEVFTKKEKKKSNETTPVEEKKETKEEKENIQYDTNATITQEEAESFLAEALDLLIEDNKDDNYIESRIFYYCISYLVKSNKYTKNEEGRFIFKESDVKEVLRKYYMRENVKYESEGFNVIYDEENKTLNILIGIALEHELSSEGPKVDVTKSVTNFKLENGIAKITYNEKKLLFNGENDQSPKEENRKIQIELFKVNNELRVKEVKIS